MTDNKFYATTNGADLILSGILDEAADVRGALTSAINDNKLVHVQANGAIITPEGVSNWITAVGELGANVKLVYAHSHLAGVLFFDHRYEKFVASGHYIPDPYDDVM